MRAVALVAALALAGCGSDEPAPTPTAEAAATPVGCGQYCQQAGGYGGGDEGELLMRVETSGAVVPKDGALPIEVSCLMDDPCRGAILVDGAEDPFPRVGRGDLRVEGNSTATILVPMSQEARAALDAAGGRLPVTINADYGDPECPPGSLLPCVAPGEAIVTAP